MNGGGTLGALVACGALVTLPLALDIWRRAGVVVLALIIAAAFFVPQRLIRSSVVGHYGIADGSPTLTTFGALFLALALGAIGSSFVNRSPRLLPATGVAAILMLLVGLFAIWTPDPEEAAGVLALLIGFAAWIVGAFFAIRLFRSADTTLFVTLILSGAVGLEAFICLLQFAGLPILPVDSATAVYIGSRANGSFEHPAVLGKAVFCVQILLMGLVTVDDSKTRSVAWAGVGLGFVSLGLSEGRASILAAASLLLVWALIVPGRRVKFGTRLLVPVVLALLALPFVGAVAERFREDPEGGERPRLTAVAYEQIARAPLAGVGPNDYVSTVSAYDTNAALGFPVHNAFLLTAAELGIPIALLFWTPLVVVLWRCWINRRAPGLTGAFSVALLAATPGLYLMLSTGWGFLTPRNLTLLFFVLGVVWAFVQRESILSTARHGPIGGGNVADNRQSVYADLGVRGLPRRRTLEGTRYDATSDET